MFAKSLAFAGLATIASAHMMMSSPAPYGKSTLDNSPLFPDGSDFPCKMRAGAFETEGASNVFEQGSKQQLAFVGTAVHGGGSCQVSITTDLEPTKNSVWKVIKSIEGGCPAQDQAGNMGDNANAEDPYKYDYTIPKELAAGNYTLAWTWFNKVGNREMYMNCAPLTVTGSGGSEDTLNSLPDMFVANVGEDCGTKPDTDLQFPSPGQDVDKLNGATDAFSPPTGNACKAGSGGSQPAPTSAVATSAAAPETTTAPSGGNSDNGNNGGDNSIPGGVFITVSDAPAPTEPAATQPASEPAATQPASEPAVTQPATTMVPVVSTPVVSEAPVATSAAPVPSDGSGSGSGDSSSGFAAGTACTTEGEWNCIGGSMFQRCASGAWSASMPLSQGVTCTPGQSTDISMTAKRGRKVMRRALRIRV
ncbi:Fc.00g050570.m01.CDS01 [Cosmosporella sp. VM-42]